MARAHFLRFVGERDPSGAPGRFIDGVPARDLTADETAALPDALYDLCLACKPALYVTAEPPKAPADDEEPAEHPAKKAVKTA